MHGRHTIAADYRSIRHIAKWRRVSHYAAILSDVHKLVLLKHPVGVALTSACCAPKAYSGCERSFLIYVKAKNDSTACNTTTSLRLHTIDEKACTTRHRLT